MAVEPVDKAASENQKVREDESRTARRDRQEVKADEEPRPPERRGERVDVDA